MYTSGTTIDTLENIMKDYGTHNLQCPKCKKLYELVHIETEFPPWWATCDCGNMLTPNCITPSIDPLQFKIQYIEDTEQLKIIENVASVVIESYMDLKDQTIIDKLQELGYHKLTRQEWNFIQSLRGLHDDNN